MLNNIFLNNHKKMQLDTNPSPKPNHDFDHFTCRRRYVTMISTFGYIFAMK